MTTPAYLPKKGKIRIPGFAEIVREYRDTPVEQLIDEMFDQEKERRSLPVEQV
jgi:hypothetical protein